MVYWVIAKAVIPVALGAGRPERATVERLGPFESRALADRACQDAASRYRGRAGASLQIVCDFS